MVEREKRREEIKEKKNEKEIKGGRNNLAVRSTNSETVDNSDSSILRVNHIAYFPAPS